MGLRQIVETRWRRRQSPEQIALDLGISVFRVRAVVGFLRKDGVKQWPPQQDLRSDEEMISDWLKTNTPTKVGRNKLAGE